MPHGSRRVTKLSETTAWNQIANGPLIYGAQLFARIPLYHSKPFTTEGHLVDTSPLTSVVFLFLIVVSAFYFSIQESHREVYSFGFPNDNGVGSDQVWALLDGKSGTPVIAQDNTGSIQESWRFENFY
ncbi:hypothetical protein M405DRAFT_491783 [Rhizopogon salebrosus TDB-379]|nr:hypothetical protein M405DRAFT_491783 [Rhizopogon salebrosus TDB-379]